VAWVKQQRETDKQTLVVDSGDLFFRKYTGPLPESELPKTGQKAQLILESFNVMQPDAVGVGDDDLSMGKEFLIEISKKAKFPILSSNLADETSGKLLFQPYIIKEVNGFRIGIFSLLSPELFLGAADLRRKGIILHSPIETAQAMVKELQPKTDLILLLSHLGYPKDTELAQAVPGIHVIAGGHSGNNLMNPPIVRNTVLLQTGAKGMYAARVELAMNGTDLSFYSAASRRALENNIAVLKTRLANPATPESAKVQMRRTLDDMERRLADLKGKNEFTNVISGITEEMKDHPDVLKMMEAYKSRFPETAPHAESFVAPNQGSPYPKR
jgi:2',3'-cyclic-nucleotide 2'-phosphodiesterase (5'-nucleotidase family)